MIWLLPAPAVLSILLRSSRTGLHPRAPSCLRALALLVPFPGVLISWPLPAPDVLEAFPAELSKEAAPPIPATLCHITLVTSPTALVHDQGHLTPGSVYSLIGQGPDLCPLPVPPAPGTVPGTQWVLSKYPLDE